MDVLRIMDIPIEVAVQIYPGYPNETCRVKAIPGHARAGRTAHHNNINNNNNNSDGNSSASAEHNVNGDAATGLVQVHINREGREGDQRSYPVTYALPFGSNQEDTYRQTTAGMIDLFLEGFDISVVTYGQHGCGKTYTILGPGIDCAHSEADQGIVPRAVRDIYGRLSRQHRNRNFAIHFGWIEICGDGIHDIHGSGNVQCMEICDIFQLLKLGLAKRSQEASHSLITLTLEQQWITADGLIQHRLSTASFVDLCGTERMYTMDAMQHQISVPKDHGLQMLERVVSVLSDPTSSAMHAANMNLLKLYDQSTLTKLLRDSFGGRAKTLLILCVSPLEQDIPETMNNLQFAYKVQLVRNLVLMNTYSDNNMPLANLIYATATATGKSAAPPSHQPQMMMGDIIGGGCGINGPANNAPDTFGLKYAADQWLKLISNAEGLFNKLLSHNETLNEQDREQIEEWMFLKQECEECLSSTEFITTQQRLLGPIQETEEPDETTTSEAASPTPQRNKHKFDADNKQMVTADGATDNESDFDDAMQQPEYLEEKIAELMDAFTIKTDKMVQDKYMDFLKSYPKGNYDSVEETAVYHPIAAVDHGSNVDSNGNPNADVEISGADCAVPCSRLHQRRGSISSAAGSSHAGGRRRSILPTSGAGTTDKDLNLSSADLAHLKLVAESSAQERLAASAYNSAYFETEKCLHSSTEAAKKLNELSQQEIGKIELELKAKQNQIKHWEETIKVTNKLISDLNINNDTRRKAEEKFQRKKVEYEKKLKKDERKLEDGAKYYDEAKMARIKENIKKIKQRLNVLGATKQITDEKSDKIAKLKLSLRDNESLVKGLQESVKLLETKLERSREAKAEKSGASAGAGTGACLDARLTNLDSVLKEKADNLRQNNGENEQLVRHEIGNLRSHRERLVREKTRLSDDKAAHRIVELNVYIETIDSAIELKNEILCGRYNNAGDGVCISNPATAVDRTGRGGGQKLGDQQLIAQLNKLSVKEMRTLLYKSLHKIMDLRAAADPLDQKVSCRCTSFLEENSGIRRVVFFN